VALLLVSICRNPESRTGQQPDIQLRTHNLNNGKTNKLTAAISFCRMKHETPAEVYEEVSSSNRLVANVQCQELRVNGIAIKTSPSPSKDVK